MTRIERRLRARLAAVVARVLSPGEPDRALVTRNAVLELDAARIERAHAAQVAELERAHAAQVGRYERVLGLAVKLAESRTTPEPIDTRSTDEIAAFEARAS